MVASSHGYMQGEDAIKKSKKKMSCRAAGEPLGGVPEDENAQSNIAEYEGWVCDWGGGGAGVFRRRGSGTWENGDL